MWNSPVGKLRILGRGEGVSFVALVGIGMPFKYLLDDPLLVRLFGPLHGFLFLWLSLATASLVLNEGWPRSRGLAVFAASLLPFGPFVIETRLRQWQKEFDDHAHS